MYIEDDKLRDKMSEILKTKSRNYVVKQIVSYGFKFQHYHLDNFMQKKPEE